MLVVSKPMQMLASRAQALRERMSAAQRCKLAHEIGLAYEQDDLSEIERQICNDIIAKLVNDEIDMVRLAIAEAVAHSPHLPAQIAQQLAEDILEISIPVLKLASNLEEHFLADIIKSGALDKISAIAERKNLSISLSRQIVAMGRKEPVINLLKNPSAQISDHTMVTIVRVYGDDDVVEQIIFKRADLSQYVLDTLRTLTEAHVSTFIQHYFSLAENVVDVEQGRKLLEGKPENTKASNWWDKKHGAV